MSKNISLLYRNRIQRGPTQLCPIILTIYTYNSEMLKCLVTVNIFLYDLSLNRNLTIWMVWIKLNSKQIFQLCAATPPLH